METDLRPTEEQAEKYARMVEAGIPSREAVDAILRGAGEDVRVVCADAWLVESRVLAARIALNGGKSWVAMSEAERSAYARRLASGWLAYAVVSALPRLTAEAPGLRRVLEFVDRLDRMEKAGAPVSGTGWTDFVEEMTKTDPDLAAYLQPPDGKRKRVQ
jgi:hypothetical protein